MKFGRLYFSHVMIQWSYKRVLSKTKSLMHHEVRASHSIFHILHPIETKISFYVSLNLLACFKRDSKKPMWGTDLDTSSIMCEAWASTFFPCHDILALQKDHVHKGIIDASWSKCLTSHLPNHYFHILYPSKHKKFL